MLRFGTISEARRAAQDEVIRAAFSGDGDALDRAIDQLRAVEEAERRAWAAEVARDDPR